MTITYEGKTYPTIKALAQAYTVNYEHLRKLLRNEWSVEDAMKVCREKIPGRGKLYEYEGKAYRSPKRMAEALGLPWSSFSHFLLRCDSVEEAVRKCRERQENRIILWGREYQGKQEVAETFGLKYTSIAYGTNAKKLSLEEVILDLLKKEPIQFEGKMYPTIVDLCACYQAHPSNVMERLSQGKTLYEAVYRPVRNNGRVNEMVYEGRTYQNAAVLCREYSISKTLVYGQKRYAKGKSFTECFHLIRQLRDECGWPTDQIFSYIPRCKIAGKFYKRLSDLTRSIGMPESQINSYKSRHRCRDLIETLRQMQKDYIPVYKTGYGLLSYTQVRAMNYSYEEMKGFPHIKEGRPRYPELMDLDLEKDCMDTLYRYEDLFGKTTKAIKKEAER